MVCRLGRSSFDGGWATEDAVDQIGDIFWWDSVEKIIRAHVFQLEAELQHTLQYGIRKPNSTSGQARRDVAAICGRAT